MAPKVLVSDALSETAVQIFRDRGVEVDYMPDLGKDKEKLAEIIGNYDGLAIRSATKVTEKLLEKAGRLKVIGRAGIGVDNVDIPAASKRGVIVMNTPFGNSVTTAEHAIALMFAVARQLPEASVWIWARIGMLRRVCGSGAARPLRPPMCRRCCLGSNGLLTRKSLRKRDLKPGALPPDPRDIFTKMKERDGFGPRIREGTSHA